MPRTELQQLWVDALRSGKYSQTKKRLHDENGFCCLGVFCDLIDPNGWVETKDDCNSVFYFNGERSYLSFQVAEKIGINRSGNLIKSIKCRNGYFEFNLANLNDAGCTFSQIADFLDAGMVDGFPGRNE